MRVWREPRVVKIVTHHENPQRAAELFAEDGVVGVGWAKAGNLVGNTKDQIKRLLKRRVEKDYSEQQAATSLLRFRDEVNVGDVVLAYRGHNKVALVGEVLGPYQFNKRNHVGNPSPRPPMRPQRESDVGTNSNGRRTQTTANSRRCERIP
jgi:restriction system protein